MRKANLMLFAVVLYGFPQAELYAADWHYVGQSTKGSTTSVMFFDSDTIAFPTQSNKNIVRVWTKMVFDKVLRAYSDSIENRDSSTKAVAQKLKNGYVPPVFKVPGEMKTELENNNEEAISVVALIEYAANDTSESEGKIYFEIDCLEKKAAGLSIVQYNDDGSISNSFDPPFPQFSYVVPESNGDSLTRLICPKE